MTTREPPALSSSKIRNTSGSSRESVPVYRFQTARVATVETKERGQLRLIWFYCPGCDTADGSRLFETELEVVVSGEERLDAVAFEHRRRTIARVLTRVTRDQAEQILAAFSKKENHGMLTAICHAPEDLTRQSYDPAPRDESRGHGRE